MSNENTVDGGTYFTAPIVQRSTNYPLTEFVIAAHLGIEEFTADNAEECLRRVKALFELYEELGVPLVYLKDEVPFSSRYANRAFIRHHLGQRTAGIAKTPEEFDRHLKKVKTSRTGIPSRSYYRITRFGASVRLAEPCVILQEVDDHGDFEIRRVELYPDGRMLWHNDEDGLEPGTTTKEWTEAAEVPLLSVLNSRAFQRAEEVPAEEFKKLWPAARRQGCKWVLSLHAPREWLHLDETESVYCGATDLTDDGSAFCTEHREIAGRMFPALFPGA
ncbi:DUF6881 domain-containing protein [Streptomyces sp. NBC_01451]|uniref:DUF6881 domain-containing protein n=1 Tax=Streptomyces sp. NBC_01451 TaxID=2903872 RepID=UPI002E30B886|nr:hypothetical protein [Streptomyces sp. NBC_01451]